MQYLKKYMGVHDGFSPQDCTPASCRTFSIKPQCSTIVLSSSQFFWVSALRRYSPGRVLLHLAFTVFYFWTVKHSSLTVWATEVSNLICSPHFRSSVSIHSQVSAFALDVPTLMPPFYRYWGHSLTHTMIQESLFLYAGLINQTLTLGTKQTTYLLFMPSP